MFTMPNVTGNPQVRSHCEKLALIQWVFIHTALLPNLVAPGHS